MIKRFELTFKKVRCCTLEKVQILVQVVQVKILGFKYSGAVFSGDKGLPLLLSNREGWCKYTATQCQGLMDQCPADLESC